MIGSEVAQEIEPEDGKLGQHLAFIGDAGAQDVVESGNAVGGHDQQPAVDLVDVADLAASVALDAREIGFQDDWVSGGVHAAFRSQSGE